MFISCLISGSFQGSRPEENNGAVRCFVVVIARCFVPSRTRVVDPQKIGNSDNSDALTCARGPRYSLANGRAVGSITRVLTPTNSTEIHAAERFTYIRAQIGRFWPLFRYGV